MSVDPRRGTLLVRLMRRVTPSDGCWLWTGATTRNGYGLIGRGARGTGVVLVHRVVYEAWIGPIPDGLDIDHLCRVRRCVNPRHLDAVTRKENVARGARWPSGRAHAAA